MIHLNNRDLSNAEAEQEFKICSGDDVLNQNKNKYNVPFIILGCIIFILICVFLIIFMLIKKKRSKGHDKPDFNPSYEFRNGSIRILLNKNQSINSNNNVITENNNSTNSNININNDNNNSINNQNSLSQNNIVNSNAQITHTSSGRIVYVSNHQIPNNYVMNNISLFNSNLPPSYGDSNIIMNANNNNNNNNNPETINYYTLADEPPPEYTEINNSVI